MANYPLIGRIVRAALFEDWLLKFICLILAVLMWFYIDGELTDQRDFTIALRPSDLVLPAGYEVATDRPMPKFTVRVRGTRRRLQLLAPENIGMKRKAPDRPHPGRNVISLKPSELEVDGVEVLSVTPKDEEAIVDLISTNSQPKTVRVKPKGEPKTGYLVGACTVEPAQVNVQGSSRDLDQVEFVWTEEIDVTGADQDIVRDVSIMPTADANGRQVPIRCNEKVRVTVSINPVEVTRKKTLDVRPVAVEGVAMVITPRQVPVEIVAEERLFADPDLMSRIVLYVEWPSAWEKPKDATTVLGPVRAQVRALAPPRVQVRGEGGGALPTVEVRGAVARALKDVE
jgi:hypothetical protein